MEKHTDNNLLETFSNHHYWNRTDMQLLILYLLVKLATITSQDA